MKRLGLLLISIIVLIPLHGYWYATTVISKYVQRCGAYATLDEAIHADQLNNGFDPQWFTDYIKDQNSNNVPYTWYVVQKVKPEYQAVFNQTPKLAKYCGGSFYEHTRQGWVGMPEHFFNAIGYLDLWMRIYHLYGGSL